ncbi:hypothetical protein O5D80_002298 [Batrachochytrium dendrobatidis]|nr:hypothetical protein O5D80_004024 [Batrachochytrium dendrobatidis]KAJ8329464.1 hypothetical protein O5D80_002298 [Batrachochytrium dendrobatidis]
MSKRSLRYSIEEDTVSGCPCIVTAVIPESVSRILANIFTSEKYSASSVLSPAQSELIVASTDTIGVSSERAL